MTSEENFKILISKAKALKDEGRTESQIAEELYLSPRDLRLLWTMDRG